MTTINDSLAELAKDVQSGEFSDEQLQGRIERMLATMNGPVFKQIIEAFVEEVQGDSSAEVEDSVYAFTQDISKRFVTGE